MKNMSMMSPQEIALKYDGNKQKIAAAAQSGLIDPTAAVMAGMFIDRMRAAAAQEQAAKTTVEQDVLAPAGLGATPQAQQLAQSQERAMQVLPPQEQGLASLPVDESMIPGGEGYAGGGIVAFSDGDLVTSDPFADVRGGRPRNPLEDVVAEQARKLGQDPKRAVEIFYLESGALKNAERAVSPKGARGLMQVMPETAMKPGFGVPSIFDIAEREGIKVKDRSKASAEKLLENPALNAQFGSMYRTAMEDRFGSPELAAAAYNAGPGAVERAGGVPSIPETQKYVSGISPQRANFIARQEAASEKVRQARREQLASGTLSPTGQPIIPGPSVMERAPEPVRDFGSEPSPFPSRENIAGRQQLFSDYVSGRTPLPAPTRGQQMIKERIEEEGRIKTAEETPKQDRIKQSEETKAAKGETYGDKLEKLLSEREGRLASQREEDKNLALLAAGLGIMGGKSPYALQNIGAGAMKGIEQYGAARKLARQEEEDILAGRLGQYRYGEESRLRAEDKRLNQGMTLASLEEKRIRDNFQKILGDLTNPAVRNALLAKIKADPDYIEKQAILGRNRILNAYGVDTGEDNVGPAPIQQDYSKWGQLKVGK